MRSILFVFLLFSISSFAQWKDYKLTSTGDTLNRVDKLDRRWGPWKLHYDNVRGEPGYEEEGWYEKNLKEGEWRLYSLQGDLVGVEYYKWGMKDSVCRYFTKNGELMAEQRWKAFNPAKQYDTFDVEDPDKLNSYHTVIVKNEGAAVKHGIWNYYDPATGRVIKSELYEFGKLEQEAKTAPPVTEKKAVAKPKEVVEFEKKNAGKKKVRYVDGSTGG
jgi:antitoxin component YwqK of YwqJK toxin-antitoxin module